MTEAAKVIQPAMRIAPLKSVVPATSSQPAVRAHGPGNWAAARPIKSTPSACQKWPQARLLVFLRRCGRFLP